MTKWYNLAPQPNWQEWLGVTVSANPSSFAFSAEALTDTITVANGSNYFTGKSVMVSSIGGSLPSPLNASSVYYIIFVSSNSFKLALTYDDALAGTEIDLTTDGSGALSIISTGVVYLQPNANGKVHTYSSLNHDLNKATYTDWTGTTENTNPIILDSKGQAVIYWAVNSLLSDDNYYIEIYTADDVLLYTRDNFNAPPGIEVSSDTSTSNPINLLINNQFDFWGMYDYGISETEDVIANCSSISGTPEIAYNWTFIKSNNNATDILTRKMFAAGQTDVPNTPSYYIQIACSSAGSGGETYKNFYQKITDVHNFAGENVTYSFWAKSATNGVIITPAIYQTFGSGGSSEVQTQGTDITLTDTWTLYSTTIAVPNLDAKNIQDGSSVLVVIELPINTAYVIDVANAQLTVSDAILPYRQLTTNERFSLLTAGQQALTGTIKAQAFTLAAPEDGWLVLENGTIGNFSSNATIPSGANPYTSSLFRALWENYDDTICPVYDSSGVKVSRGADAYTDFNANYQIQMFFNSGRVISNVGLPNIQFTFEATIDSNHITMAAYSSKTIFLGTAVQFTTTGTLPSPLVAATTYYLVPVLTDYSIYTIATSFQNAVDGTVIVISTVGTGIQTCVVSTGNAEFKDIVAGQAIGEYAHYQSTAELSAHYHQNYAYNADGGPPNAAGFCGASTSAGAVIQSSTTVGATNAMNITQQTIGLPHLIKL